MDLLTIVQLLTLVVSLLSIIITAIIAIRTSKSQNIANTIATQRIRFMEQYRQLTSTLLTLCSPIILNSNQLDIREILQTAYSLKGILRTCYEEERMIVNSVNSLLNSSFEFINNPNNPKLEEAVNNDISHIIQLIETYDLAYWEFIIDQATGLHFKVDDFEVYYSNAEQRFKLSRNEPNK